ncbi:TetR/AcrR family transcriptional regulator [Actinoallomurus acanthiterrae]
METAPRRGRPRSRDADARIVDTALELLLDRGYDRFAVEEVAAKAGVAKTTIYRRWPTKDHLIVAVVARVMDQVPVAYSGDVRADLTRYLGEIVGGLDRMRRVGRTATAGEASAGLVAEIAAAAARHADVGATVQEMFARRNALVLTLLQTAKEAGELRPDAEPEVVFDQLAGALYYRLLVTGQPIDTAYVHRLVSSTLTGAAPSPGE